MGKKLYVGNLAYGVSDSDLQQMFEAHGTVAVGSGHHGPRYRPLQRLRLRGDGQRSGGSGRHRRPQWQGSRWPRSSPSTKPGPRKAAAAVVAAPAAAAGVATVAAVAAVAAVVTKSIETLLSEPPA